MSFLKEMAHNSVLTHAAGALLAGAIAASGTYIFTPTRVGPPPFETTTRDGLQVALREAKRRVIATGYVLSNIDADFIKSRHDASSKFEATVVMTDPLGIGGPNRAMCQRQRDEDGPHTSYSNYGRVLNKLKEFHSPAKTGNLIGGDLKIGLLDKYPTMAVFMVDDDLYVYFYPYQNANDSPVIKFENYSRTRDVRGDFFDEHLNKVTGYRNRSAAGMTKFLVTPEDWLPYDRADTNQPCTKK